MDIIRVEQILANLLTNAIKYAPGSPVKISARFKGDLLELIVADQGPGIAQEDQDRIFMRFERAVSGNHFGGLGLGLYIVRQILQAHGGSIFVNSEIGKGCTFIVQIPKDQVGQEEIVTSKLPKAQLIPSHN